MKAKIKSLMIIDDLFTLPHKYMPQNRNDFDIGFSLEIGPENKDGSNIFDIRISNDCAQSETILVIDNIVFKKGCIQMNHYDYYQALEAIRKYIDTIDFSSWEEIALELSKVFDWEFENYIQ